ncbi:MAG: efflux RND transporter periplasmic adaptor subunit [Gemmatimonadales bacterium]|nr:efflux RND transporter periplasmic adaptor subunit [Candidatus Palauibacter irciniicola]MYC18449.1 efflux RND transporter periplasmic adaptor subunit [Gemmatimonadales bacterium]
MPMSIFERCRRRFPRRGGPLGRTTVFTTLGLAAAGCATGEANEPEQTLQTLTVGRQTIVSSVEATGTVEPIRVIEVKSQAGGEVLDLPVELGDNVEQGTLLVRIDPRDVNNAHAQAQADLDVAEAQADVAERQLERIEALHESDIVTSEELESAILSAANARASLVRATTNLELAEDKLDDVTLRAPITGTVVERTVEQGQVVTGTRDLTGGTVLMRMADLTEVQVRMLVDETDIGRLQPGLPADITVEAYPNRTFRGSVLKIEPQAVVEQNVTMFAVLTRISNEDDLLRPGMNADVEVVIGRQADVLAVSNSGIKTQQEAMQIVRALEIDADVNALLRDFQSQDRPEGAAEGDGPAEGEEEQMIGGVPMSEFQSMSQEERMRVFQNLSDEERRRMMQQFRNQGGGGPGGGGGGAARRADEPRPAFVFRYDESGLLDLKPVMIGLSDFDHTHIIRGLEEGEEIVAVPTSLIAQQEFLDRIRSRTSLPGIGGR